MLIHLAQNKTGCPHHKKIFFSKTSKLLQSPHQENTYRKTNVLQNQNFAQCGRPPSLMKSSMTLNRTSTIFTPFQIEGKIINQMKMCEHNVYWSIKHTTVDSEMLPQT